MGFIGVLNVEFLGENMMTWIFEHVIYPLLTWMGVERD